jgi:hypothetical protein
MKEITKTYVEFSYPGALFAETEDKEIITRDVKKVLKIMPKGAFCFRFYDMTSKEVTIDGEQETVFGKEKNKSGKYYPGATPYTIEQVKKMGKDFSILASNMECNNWPTVIKTRIGNFQPLEKGDIIL